jgi:outer membrane receptor protein involved in Fe transport
VKNFTDEEYKAYSLDLGILGATATYAPPRMYGLTAAYHF